MGYKAVNDLSKRPVCHEAGCQCPAVVNLSRPTGDDALDGRIGSKLHPIQSSLTTRSSEGFHHLAHGNADAGQVDAAEIACGGKPGGPQEVINYSGGAFTGQMALSPCRGSRIMLLTNDEAARFGLPGRTQIVGSRRTSPST